MPLPQRQAGGTPARRSPPQENVLDRIGAMEFDPNEGLNFLLYGDSGSGKTTVWGSFPGETLCIVCSGGQKPGELRSLNTAALRARIDTVTLKVPSELDEIVRAVDMGVLKHKRTGKPYRNIVLDHVSGFQDLKLMVYKSLSEIPQQKSYGIATRQDWGEIAAQVKEHLVKLLSLRCNVIVIAQERIFLPGSDDAAKDVKQAIDLSGVLKPKVGAALSPSIAGWLHPAVDYGIQTFKRGRQIREEEVFKGKPTGNFTVTRGEGVDYCARVGAHDIYYTKFRVPGVKIPEVIYLGNSIDGVQQKPSAYEQIMAYINGGEK